MMLNIAEIMNFVVPQIGIGIHLALSVLTRLARRPRLACLGMG